MENLLGPFGKGCLPGEESLGLIQSSHYSRSRAKGVRFPASCDQRSRKPMSQPPPSSLQAHMSTSIL